MILVLVWQLASCRQVNKSKFSGIMSISVFMLSVLACQLASSRHNQCVKSPGIWQTGVLPCWQSGKKNFLSVWRVLLKWKHIFPFCRGSPFFVCMHCLTFCQGLREVSAFLKISLFYLFNSLLKLLTVPAVA